MAARNTVGILTDMALETTIKVSRDLRDRVNAAAREQRMTPSRLIEALLEEYEHERWMAGVVAEINAAPADDEPEPPYPKPEGFDDLELFRFDPLPPGEPDPYPKPDWIRRLEADASNGGDAS